MFRPRILILCTGNSCRSRMQVFRRVRDEIKLVFEAYAAGYRDAISPTPAASRPD